MRATRTPATWWVPSTVLPITRSSPKVWFMTSTPAPIADSSRALDLGAGPVASGVDDAIVAVTALTGQCDVQVEARAWAGVVVRVNAAPRRIR